MATLLLPCAAELDNFNMKRKKMELDWWNNIIIFYILGIWICDLVGGRDGKCEMKFRRVSSSVEHQSKTEMQFIEVIWYKTVVE